MKLQKEMEQVFFNWCSLFDLEQNYKYVNLFFKDSLSFYNIPIKNNSSFILDKTKSVDILNQIDKNNIITSTNFTTSNIIRFICEINNNLRIKHLQYLENIQQ